MTIYINFTHIILICVILKMFKNEKVYIIKGNWKTNEYTYQKMVYRRSKVN